MIHWGTQSWGDLFKIFYQHKRHKRKPLYICDYRKQEDPGI